MYSPNAIPDNATGAENPMVRETHPDKCIVSDFMLIFPILLEQRCHIVRGKQSDVVGTQGDQAEVQAQFVIQDEEDRRRIQIEWNWVIRDSTETEDIAKFRTQYRDSLVF